MGRAPMARPGTEKVRKKDLMRFRREEPDRWQSNGYRSLRPAIGVAA